MPTTFTPRLGLGIQDPGDDYDIEIHNTNYLILDGDTGSATVCTSSTRPSTPTNGMVIYETDSSNLMVRDTAAAAWKASHGKYLVCTSGTRPASGLTYGGFPIYETDTGNRLIRNAANTAWLPLSPYQAADETARNALGVLPDGFIVVTDNTGQIWQETAGGFWCPVQGTVVQQRIVPGFVTTTSTGFTSTLSSGSGAGVVFLASGTGRVVIVNNAYMFNSGANSTIVGFRIRTGNVIGSGTIITSPNDDDSLLHNGTSGFSLEKTTVVPSLNPGSEYNVQQMFRVTAGTGTFNRMAIAAVAS